LPAKAYGSGASTRPARLRLQDLQTGSPPRRVGRDPESLQGD
jgi:hypothetical protein